MKTTAKNQKPLYSINYPVKMRAYKAKFRAFTVTRYLDRRKLKSARKISIEVGTIEAAGRSATLVAQIQNNMIVGLKLKACAGCKPMSKSRQAAYKRLMPELIERTNALPGRKLSLPMPLMFTAKDIIRIPMGPIVIVIETSPEICVMVQVGSRWCVICADMLYCSKFDI